jgi:acyl dehydratase
MIRIGKSFEELNVADIFEESMTITETHVVKSAGLFRDFNVLHTNEPEMYKSRFRKRIVHGALTFGLMVGVYSNVFHDTDISTVEASIKFTAPIYINDTIKMTWEVKELEEKTKLNGGLVTITGQVENQEGTICATTYAKLLVSNTTIFE